MKKIILVVLLGIVSSIPLSAKATQPMSTQLMLDDYKVVGDTIEYKLTYECRPWVNSKKVLFTLKMPSNFTLVDGFSYWEGEIAAKTVFSHKFTIVAPATEIGMFTISAKMLFENSQSFKNTSLSLGRDEARDAPKLKSLTLEKSTTKKTARKTGSRPIFRQ